MADEKKNEGFIDTADPNVITYGDFIRWCEELTQHVKENPSGKGWGEKSLLLHQRLASGESIIRRKAPQIIEDAREGRMKKSHAAALLGITRQNLSMRLKRERERRR